jgi:predicted aldo/keto reductase-like oxidoreductase
MTPAIVAAINTGKFDYVNLHYHYIGSYTASGSGPEKNANAAALQAAKQHDMGVFIISPYDKGGMRKRYRLLS